MFTRSITTTLKVLSQNHTIRNHGIDVVKLPQIAQFSNKVNWKNPIAAVEVDPETGEKKKKKAPPIPRITLLSGKDISVTTLEEAQRLAKRRDLKLVKILDLDTKTQRPIYQLMTGAEYYEEDLKQRERKKEEKQSGYKGEKVLMISQNISEHDLQTHINKIVKWLAKRYGVRMVINGNQDNIKKAEEVYSFLEKHLSSYGRIVQKRQKGSDIKFQVIPPKEPKTTNSDERDNGKPV